MEYRFNNRNVVKRNPKRASYDKETIHNIIDDSLICNIAFNIGDQPYIIPTIHVRKDETIFLHGASTSRLLDHIESGNHICLAFNHVDGIVLARSVFHHSMNYRSAIVFGNGRPATEKERYEVFELLTEKLIPGRWNNARLPSDKEIKATKIAAIEIVDASAKIRTGGPIDEPADYDLNVWSGVIPIKQVFETPIPDEKLRDGIAIPDYLQNFHK